MLHGDGKVAMAMAMEGIRLFLHPRSDAARAAPAVPPPAAAAADGKRAMHREGSKGEFAVVAQRKKSTEATVVQWSGCQDDQTSADTRINGVPTGAMSWAFMKALNELPDGTYLQILQHVRGLLQQHFTQVAQLS
ncbi:Ca(2+)-dependent cysteine protease, partial [Cladochytrium tenue]